MKKPLRIGGTEGPDSIEGGVEKNKWPKNRCRCMVGCRDCQWQADSEEGREQGAKEREGMSHRRKLICQSAHHLTDKITMVPKATT